MTNSPFETLLSELEKRAAQQKNSAFDVDGVFACCAASAQERGVHLSQLATNAPLTARDISLLLCFDVIAVASALALRQCSDDAASGADPRTTLVDLWGGAQAARALWHDHFVAPSGAVVEGRREALEETARVLSAQAVGFSLTQGRNSTQFAEFVAKDFGRAAGG